MFAREAAAEYLEMVQDEVDGETRAHLLAAAKLHHPESETMGTAHDQMPWGNVRGEELRKRLERPNRAHLAKVILKCKGYYAGAIAEIGKALEDKRGVPSKHTLETEMGNKESRS
jgi:hypothetical protein